MSVPFSACSNLPGLSRYAPVKAPRWWPNSSDSSNSSGRAAQLTFRNWFMARDDAAWIARATTSLPTPLSPVNRTVAFVTATFAIISRTARIPGLVQRSKGFMGGMHCSVHAKLVQTRIWVFCGDSEKSGTDHLSEMHYLQV